MSLLDDTTDAQLLTLAARFYERDAGHAALLADKARSEVRRDGDRARVRLVGRDGLTITWLAASPGKGGIRFAFSPAPVNARQREVRNGR